MVNFEKFTTSIFIHLFWPKLKVWYNFLKNLPNSLCTSFGSTQRHQNNIRLNTVRDNILFYSLYRLGEPPLKTHHTIFDNPIIGSILSLHKDENKTSVFNTCSEL